jgi:RNA polymerase-interacting CarD/CdnL/TRCF family regulator
VSFRVGDKVVYPQHGATVIEDIQTLQAFGASCEYLGCCGLPMAT